jgi:CBS domain-containing protein
MKIGSLCNQKIICARKDETVLTAARRMRDHHVGSLVIIEGDDDHCVPAGILTDRDIVVGVIARDSEHLPQLLVGDIMTRKPVIAVSEDEVSEVVKTMRRYGIRRIPVVDTDGCLLGIASLDDIIEHLAEQLSTLAQTVIRQPRAERQSRP